MVNEFGIYLSKLREERKLTLRDVEKKVTISNAYLSQVEQGKKGIPTIKILRKLSVAYGVPIADMMEKAEKASRDEKIDTTAPAPDLLFVVRGYEKLPEDKKKLFQNYLKLRTEITMGKECYHCSHKREVPGNCHISCSNPDKEMEGNPHGIQNGWFIYPLLFDPVWKEKKCRNFEKCKESE